MNINVKVIPRARQNKITQDSPGNFKVHTNTAPQGGKANEAVIAQIAVYFGIPKSHIKLVRGATAHTKVFALRD